MSEARSGRLRRLLLQQWPSLIFIAVVLMGALPVGLNIENRYIRLPILDQGHEVAVSTSSAPVLKGTGTYTDERDLWLFEWGTAVSIECVARACFCIAMDDDSIDIGSNTTCGAINDTGTAGNSTANNACVTVPAGGRVDFIVMRNHWSGYGLMSAGDPSGYREGYCNSTATSTPNYPCDADNDCLAGGSSPTGGCTIPGDGTGLNTISGAFLVSEALAATSCSIRKDL